MEAAAGRPESQEHLQEPLANEHWTTGGKPEPRCNCNKRTVALRVILGAVFLGLLVTVIVLAVSLSGRSPAVQGPACPDGWVGYQGKCFYLSESEGNWTYSRSRCSALGASLAGIDTLQEMDFLLRYKGKPDYWIGLCRDPGQPWKWANGTEFNRLFGIGGDGDCAYLNEKKVSSLRCSGDLPWICSKPDAFTAAKETPAGGVSLSGRSSVVQGPACPDTWIWYQGKCFYFSEGEENWPDSRSRCSALQASLAAIDTLQEMDFMQRYKGKPDYWIGLRRHLEMDQWQTWKWTNGTKFNNWFGIGGDGDCAYLNEKKVSSLRCSGDLPWICSKPDALTAAKETPAGGVSLPGRSPAAQGPACPDTWVGYQGKCFYFSEDEGNWTYSRSHCSALGASLAAIDTLQEMDFLQHHKGKPHHWIGLRRNPGQPWKWANGTEFNNWFEIQGGGDCVYLNDEKGASSSRCSGEKRWVCSKPDTFTKAKEAAGEGSR